MRSVSERSAKSLKTATRYGLDLVSGPESFQHVVRVSQGQLSKYASLSDDYAASFMPIDIAVELDLMAGTPVVVGAMARLLGYRLVKDEPQKVETSLTHRDLSRLSLEFDDLRRVTHDALDDDKLDHAERRSIRREAGELARELEKFIEKIGC